MSLFKLRASHGSTGQRPRFSAQYQTFTIAAGQSSADLLLLALPAEAFSAIVPLLILVGVSLMSPVLGKPLVHGLGAGTEVLEIGPGDALMFPPGEPHQFEQFAVRDLLRRGSTTTISIEEAQQALASEILPIDDVRSTAEYRLRVSANLLKQWWVETGDADR